MLCLQASRGRYAKTSCQKFILVVYDQKINDMAVVYWELNV